MTARKYAFNMLIGNVLPRTKLCFSHEFVLVHVPPLQQIYASFLIFLSSTYLTSVLRVPSFILNFTLSFVIAPNIATDTD